MFVLVEAHDASTLAKLILARRQRAFRDPLPIFLVSVYMYRQLYVLTATWDVVVSCSYKDSNLYRKLSYTH